MFLTGPAFTFRPEPAIHQRARRARRGASRQTEFACGARLLLDRLAWASVRECSQGSWGDSPKFRRAFRRPSNGTSWLCSPLRLWVQPIDELLHRHGLVVLARLAPVPLQSCLPDPQTSDSRAAIRLGDSQQDPIAADLRLYVLDSHVHWCRLLTLCGCDRRKGYSTHRPSSQDSAGRVFRNVARDEGKDPGVLMLALIRKIDLGVKLLEWSRGCCVTHVRFA